MIQIKGIKVRSFLSITFLLGLLLIFAGCEFKPDKSLALGGDWSRGVRLGAANLREAGGLAIEPNGEALFLLWPKKTDAGMRIHLAIFDQQLKPVVGSILPVDLFFPHSIKLIQDPFGGLHAFALARVSSAENQQLFYFQLNRQGELIRQPVSLSPGHHDVEGYDVSAWSDGETLVVWSALDRGIPVLFRLDLGVDGQVRREMSQLAADARDPAVIIDGDQTAHVLWVHEPSSRSKEYIYTTLKQSDRGAPAGTLIARSPAGTGAIFSPPVIGHDSDYVYVFWTVEYRAGMEQGSASTFFVSFPNSRPAESTPLALRVSDSGTLPLAPHESPLLYHQLLSLPPVGAASGSKFVAYPAPLSNMSAEMPVLVVVQTAFRMQEDIQPGMAVFSGGKLIGYQLVARTNDFSWSPAGAVDQQGGLYAVWTDMEGGGEYGVFLASTSPAWKSNINRVTLKDAAWGTIGFLWSMISGLTLTPLAIITFVLPLLWLGVYYVFGSEDNLREKAPLAAMVIAAALYYGMKVLLFSAVIAFPPFSRLVAPGIRALIMYGLPALILALSTGVFLLYMKRAEAPRLFKGFFIFAFCDVILTMLLYGPGFFD